MIMLLIIVVLVLECRTRIENGPLLRPITNTGHQNIVYSDNNRPFLTSIHDLKNSDKEYSYNCGPDQQECLVSAEYNGNYIPDIVSRCRLSDKLQPQCGVKCSLSTEYQDCLSAEKCVKVFDYYKSNRERKLTEYLDYEQGLEMGDDQHPIRYSCIDNSYLHNYQAGHKQPIIQLMGGLTDHIRLAKHPGNQHSKKRNKKLIGHEFVEILDERKVTKDKECIGKKVGDNCKILVKENSKKETVINEITYQIKEVIVPKDELVKVEDIYKDGQCQVVNDDITEDRELQCVNMEEVLDENRIDGASVKKKFKKKINSRTNTADHKNKSRSKHKSSRKQF